MAGVLTALDIASRAGRFTRSAPWLVVAVWLTCVMFAFWYFELRLQSPLEGVEFAFFDSDVRVRAIESWFRVNIQSQSGNAAPGRATVVHLYQKGCTCNRDVEPHLARIEELYRKRGVRVIRIERRAASAGGDADWITATPASLVFDGAGRLEYFGPYNVAGWCGASGSLVEGVLDRTLSGRPQRIRSISARGCFCGVVPVESKGNMQ